MIIPWEHQDYKNTHEKKIYVNSYSFIYLKGRGGGVSVSKEAEVVHHGGGGVEGDYKIIRFCQLS